MVLRDIKIDPEFQKRLRPQTPEEAAAMRQSIDEVGYLTPLLVWAGQGLLIDGHHRYGDWQRRQAEFESSKPKGITSMLRSQPKPPPAPDFVQMQFADRQAVLSFIDELQYGQRNLTEGQMALIRARFITRAKQAMPESQAVEASVEKFDVSPATARRDAKLGVAIEKIAPLVLEKTGKTMDDLMATPDAPDRTDILQAASQADEKPDEAVVNVTRTAKDKRKKPRTDNAESPKPPSWEKHLASLTMALEKLWKDSVDEERSAVKAKLREFVKHVNALDKSLSS